MPHHYPKNTTEAPAWCNTCWRQTQHAVFDGRLAHCLEHGPKVDAEGLSKTQAEARKKREEEKQNPELPFK
jgi:hypothetical protein